MYDIYITFLFSFLSPLPYCSLWCSGRWGRGRGRGGCRLDRGCSYPVVCGVCGAGDGLQRLVEGEAVPWVAEPHRAGAEIPGGPWESGHTAARGRHSGRGYCADQIR